MTFFKNKNDKSTIFMGSKDLFFTLTESNLDESLELWRSSREHSDDFDKIIIGMKGQRSTVKIEFNIKKILNLLLDDEDKAIEDKRLKIKKTIIFYRVTFEKDVFCEDIEFLENLEFHQCEFNSILIKNCHSEQKIVFNRGKISTVQFLSTDIKCVEVKKVLTKSDTYLMLTLSKFEQLALENFILHGLCEIQDTNISQLSLMGLTVQGNLIINDSTFNCEDWQTACVFKNEELKRNNTKQALEYHAEEKNLHRKDSWKNHKYGEWLSLLLSKIVNNHGQSWFQAFCFTLVVWILCFSIFYLPNPCKYWYYWVYLFEKGIYTAELFQYFVPTNYDQIIEYVKISELDLPIKFGGVLAYILGKIFVPYGIFEIIKAFRKYR